MRSSSVLAMAALLAAGCAAAERPVAPERGTAEVLLFKEVPSPADEAARLRRAAHRFVLDEARRRAATRKEDTGGKADRSADEDPKQRKAEPARRRVG